MAILDEFEIPYICRVPSKWKIFSYGVKRHSRQMFSKHRLFYFDRHLDCSLFARKGRFADHEVKLVGVANSRKNLLKRWFYCLLTNQTNFNHTEVLSWFDSFY